MPVTLILQFYTEFFSASASQQNKFARACSYQIATIGSIARRYLGEQIEQAVSSGQGFVDEISGLRRRVATCATRCNILQRIWKQKNAVKRWGWKVLNIALIKASQTTPTPRLDLVEGLR
jgi:hypothetical protein